MENLLFGRTVTRLYDLKGSSRSRYNPDSSGSNKVLLDQNLIEAMPTSPIFVGNKAKRLLERAVWNDTAFLAVSSETLFSVCCVCLCTGTMHEHFLIRGSCISLLVCIENTLIPYPLINLFICYYFC